MGVSLEQHVAELKKHPGLKVEIREDWEFNKIIRLTMKKEFSFNLDDVMNFDEEKAKIEILDECEKHADVTEGWDIDEIINSEWMIK